MSARGRSPFLREVGAALALSAAAGALGALLTPPLPPEQVARGVVAALGLAYLLHVLAHSRETTGRVAVVALWGVASAALWLAGAPLAACAAVQAALLSLARSLWLRGRLAEAALDAALSALALCFAFWAATRTQSLFLASWTFFLAQAAHVAIPGLAARGLGRRRADVPLEDPNRDFAAAHGAAEEALRRIAARR